MLTSAPVRGALGDWVAGDRPLATEPEAVVGAVRLLREPLALVEVDGRAGVGVGGQLRPSGGAEPGARPAFGWVPALRPEHLGDPAFLAAHGLRFPYVAGAMANGIGSEAIVEAMGRAGMLGFFGAGGLPLPRVEAAIDRVQAALGDAPYGFNLLHAPNEPDHERDTVELYLRRGVRLVEAAAYLDLTLPLVRYRTAGIHLGPDGRPVPRQRVMAKVSRVEVAAKFLAPPPDAMLRKLVEAGQLTEEQAAWARLIPMADDLTAEADSGGHTDNRPAITLLPTMIALRDQLQAQHGFAQPPRVGLAGGVATPQAVAAAFSLGAAYVVTGSINQACVESGSSDVVREMLAQAGQADVAMAPAGDMFEMGVKVQVLKRGTMFPMRASRLYELYRAHDSLEALPDDVRRALEKDYFRKPLGAIWDETKQFFQTRDPAQVERAERDPRHKLALVFRWYLGHASRWANAGEPTRKLDYQVWCGPAMGAFNAWTAGTHLAAPAARRVVPVALNLLAGACALRRLEAARVQAAGAGLSLATAADVASVLNEAEVASALA
ncbi:MAG: PfaD family polyunsaturated fatty acid/polyketide biosynthesis protein [Candidatus Sericytochromatia bacterium]|nr:PfaD family polyunsaturated fatty acid/polyketide biosynthesis protein [Candidatus Sericytochromatia bacterium]